MQSKVLKGFMEIKELAHPLCITTACLNNNFSLALATSRSKASTYHHLYAVSYANRKIILINLSSAIINYALNAGKDRGFIDARYANTFDVGPQRIVNEVMELQLINNSISLIYL